MDLGSKEETIKRPTAMKATLDGDFGDSPSCRGSGTPHDENAVAQVTKVGTADYFRGKHRNSLPALG